VRVLDEAAFDDALQDPGPCDRTARRSPRARARRGRAPDRPGGALARGFPGYEQRDAQLAFALDVARALAGGGVLLAEAPTGVGKSLGTWSPRSCGRAANANRSSYPRTPSNCRTS
jgi:hypothetical protein